MFPPLIEKLGRHEDLTMDEASAAMAEIMSLTFMVLLFSLQLSAVSLNLSHSKRCLRAFRPRLFAFS